MELSAFNLILWHSKGELNEVADCLSRAPINSENLYECCTNKLKEQKNSTHEMINIIKQ